MTYLILGLVLFLGAHAAIMLRDFRANIVAKIGTNGWRAGVSLAAFVGLVLIAYGFSEYRAQGYIQLYEPPFFLRHLALLLNLPVFVLIFAAYLSGHIKAKLKHPMLVAIKLWALAHLCANGDLGSVLLFGSIMIWAVLARIAIKRREMPEPPVSQAVSVRNDLIALLLGIAVYLLLIMGLHKALIGVSPL